MFLQNFFLIVLINLLLFNNLILSLPVNTTYIQRQTGKYNINIHIKDVAIIAIDGISMDNGSDMDNDGDYDYDYNYDDFTIKPSSGLFGSAGINNKPTNNLSSITAPATAPTTTTTTKPEIIEILKPIMNQSIYINNNNKQTTKKPSMSQNVVILTDYNEYNNNNNHITKNDNNIIMLMNNTNSTKIELNGTFNNLTENNFTKLNNVNNDNRQEEIQIPVEVIIEPVLKLNNRYHHHNKNNYNINKLPNVNYKSNNRNIYNDLIVTPSISAITNNNRKKRCTLNEIRDHNGKCRIRRSGLQTLINLITSLAANRTPNDQET